MGCGEEDFGKVQCFLRGVYKEEREVRKGKDQGGLERSRCGKIEG